MFIRIVWNTATGLRHNQPRNLRRINMLGKRDANDLGIPSCDFHRMTRSLFDRHD